MCDFIFCVISDDDLTPQGQMLGIPRRSDSKGSVM